MRSVLLAWLVAMVAACTSGTNCRARCGAGCAAIGTSVCTQQCGDHDYCESHHNDFGASCSDQAATASDDYTAAPNCGC